MKFPTKEELNEYTHALAIGAGKGLVVGAGISAVGYFYAKRRIPIFFTYGAFPRTFFMMAPPIMCALTSTEWASRNFEKTKYGYVDVQNASPDMLIPKFAGKEQSLNGAVTGPVEEEKKQTILEQVSDNKYKFIMSGWAASMVGSYWLVNRDKFMTKSQKIVQARMYAQGITVILLLASVMLSVGASNNDKSRQGVVELTTADGKPVWEQVVDQEVARETAAHLPLHLSERKDVHTHHDKA